MSAIALVRPVSVARSAVVWKVVLSSAYRAKLAIWVCDLWLCDRVFVALAWMVIIEMVGGRDRVPALEHEVERRLVRLGAVAVHSELTCHQQRMSAPRSRWTSRIFRSPAFSPASPP